MLCRAHKPGADHSHQYSQNRSQQGVYNTDDVRLDRLCARKQLLVIRQSERIQSQIARLNSQ